MMPRVQSHGGWPTFTFFVKVGTPAVDSERVSCPDYDSCRGTIPCNSQLECIRTECGIFGTGVRMMIEKRFRLPALFLTLILTSLYGAAQQKVDSGLTAEYNRWIDEDVRWIITLQEKEEFLKFGTDAERDHFVIEFWERRNPDPGSKDNPFKEEHYRRLAFSNQHFAERVAGWKTDRGHVYIVYGPPDSIIKHSYIGTNPPEELWNYRHMPGSGDDETLEFIDHCVCGEYALKGNLPNGN